MTQQNRCPRCGAELAADAPQGLCPACLLKRGLESQTGDGGGSRPDAVAYAPPTPTELTPLFPDLKILELVGRGGMGVVYKARQKRLDRLVALKILSPSIGKEPAFADRFAREARAMAMLSHPHIVAVYDFGQTGSPLPPGTSGGEGESNSPRSPGEGQGVRAVGSGGLYYFLMEYVDGLNLRRLLDAGKLAPPEALAIVPQICEALQYAHDKGVVHRDIKPENVLLDKDGQVKIADFGLAKLMGREAKDFTLTGAGQVMGTPNYMAPEQIEHPQDVDHRADIYSLGVVFYQMLTGELPLGRFAPPSQKVQIDVRLDEVVLRALEKEPRRRYQQASQVKSEVQTIAGTSKSAQADDGAAAAAIAQAVRKVSGPYAGLELTALFHLLFVPFSSIAVISLAAKLGNKSDLIMLVPPLLIAAWVVLVLLAAKMKELQGYWQSVIASTLAVVFSPANLIGLPIGIWALVALSRRDVRAAFALVASQSKERRAALGAAAPATTDATAWRSPESGWGWLVGKIFGITFTSRLAYHCANLSALGFLGILYAVGYASPDLHWCFRFSGLFGFFGLIGVAHVVEAFSRLKGRRSARSWLRVTFVFLAVLLAILVIARVFLCEAYVVPSDSAAPEVPRGSRILAWKLTSMFVPRDLIVYRFEGHNNVGRVVRYEGADLIVNRNGEPNAKVAREDVIGKVICVYWRASAAAPEGPGKSTDRVPETPQASGQAAAPTAAAPIKKSVPNTSAASGGMTKSLDLQKAQDERVRALQKAFDIVDAQYRIATATAEERMAALDALLEAQLDAAKTKPERIAVLQKLLDNRRSFEKIVWAQFTNGRCSEAELDKAKAESLGAEIRLAKETSAAGADNPSPAANRKAEKSIRELQEERMLSLAKTFVIIDAQYRVARADFGQRVAASDALLEAQLDAAETKSARMAILQKLLENRREVEKITEARFKSGSGSEADWLQAKADRVAAEGRLAKEKAAAGPDDSSSKPVDPTKPRGPILLYTTFGGSNPIPKGMTRAELMDKLLAAIDRRLNAGAEKLARVRTLGNGSFIEVAVLRPADADSQRVQRLLDAERLPMRLRLVP